MIYISEHDMVSLHLLVLSVKLRNAPVVVFSGSEPKGSNNVSPLVPHTKCPVSPSSSADPVPIIEINASVIL